MDLKYLELESIEKFFETSKFLKTFEQQKKYLLSEKIKEPLNVSGVYVIYRKCGACWITKYAGSSFRTKDKSNRGIRDRLSRHRLKLKKRNYDLRDFAVKYMLLPDLSYSQIRLLEHLLINYYKPEWQESGFGRKDKYFENTKFGKIFAPKLNKHYEKKLKQNEIINSHNST